METRTVKLRTKKGKILTLHNVKMLDRWISGIDKFNVPVVINLEDIAEMLPETRYYDKPLNDKNLINEEWEKWMEYKNMPKQEQWNELKILVSATHFTETDKDLFLKLIKEYSNGL